MKVLQINTVYTKGSTGKIAFDIHNACKEKGIDCITAYRYAEAKPIEDSVEVSSWLDCHIHNRLAKYTGLQGCYSKFKTYTFLKKVKKYKPDIIHLHNLHGSYINLKMLFRYIKKNNIRVVWTLHDCWAFTGLCSHFTMAKCDKWRTNCFDCVLKREKKSLLFDTSNRMYRLKKTCFTGVKNMTLITPSKWLYDLVKESFLKDYPAKIIYHGVDLDVFSPVSGNIREKLNIPETKKIILGVAFGWGCRKGLDIFVELAKRLDCCKYQIVLVGTNDEVDKRLPENIISVHRTYNQRQLAEFYSAADVFVNPTREEMFGLVNVEANACGTPVVTFRTGGCPECIDDASGVTVACDDVDAMEREIIRVCTEKPFTMENCIKRAKQFDKTERFKEYINLYEKRG